mgnify:CR=1 FL=1
MVSAGVFSSERYFSPRLAVFSRQTNSLIRVARGINFVETQAGSIYCIENIFLGNIRDAMRKRIQRYFLRGDEFHLNRRRYWRYKN